MRCLVIAGRLIRQIAGDKRTLALILLAPMFILFILHIVLTSGVTKAKIAVLNDAGADIAVLRENAVISEPSGELAAIGDVKAGRVDACLVIRESGDYLLVNNADPAIVGLVKGTYARFAADRASKEMQAKLAPLRQLLANLPDTVKKQVILPDISAMKLAEPVIEDLYALGGAGSVKKEFDFFDNIAAGIMGFIIFFLVFLLSGIAFLRERISGTLERMMASSVRRWEIVAGYLLGFGAFVFVQTVIIQSFLLYVLKVNTLAGFWEILAVNLVAASTSLALGTLLSAFARNEFQLFQFIPVIIIPQVLFSGLFDLREAPAWVNWLSQAFPLTYTAGALKDMMIKGRSLADLWVNLVVLAGFTLVFVWLNIIALKKYRRA